MIAKQLVPTNNALRVVGPHFHRRLSIAILMSLALMLSAINVTPAYAATLVVTNTSNGGAGSLRQALADAGVGNTITFDASLSGGTIYLASMLTLTKDISIDASALTNKITLSGDTDNNGTGNVRVLYINSGVTATLNNIVVTKGHVTDVGGGIYNNEGTLTVTNSTISNNSSTHPGGGIENLRGTLIVINSTIIGNSSIRGGGIENYEGTASITNSTISNNSVTSNGDGGGIETLNGTLTITDSTISGNSAAAFGGGIYNSSTTTITNSTIVNNSATYQGGGILNCTTLTITNSTIVGNSGQTGGGIGNCGTLTIINSTLSGNSATRGAGGGGGGGGIYQSHGTLNYVNTIIANSVREDCIVEIFNGSIGTNVNNLVEDGSCSAAFSGDPKLGLRANNGGPTQTLALLTGSPAIDAGDDATCTNAPVNGLDQRGVTRPVGAHCDIGAFEGEVAPPLSMTFTSIAEQDGWVLESSENSGIGGSSNATSTTFRLGDDAARKQYLGILSFSTSSIPDTATITGVTLKMKQQGIAGGGSPFSIFSGLMVDIKNGFFNARVLQITDFQTDASKTLGPILISPVNGVYSINLASGKTFINKLATNGGLTQIRLRFKLDDNNDAIANYLSLYSSNAGAAANRPQLVIVYTP